mmetsp:Transcript_14125/g.40143  ORF Transcript_14125/g.40143 Transcript_14125/m.40143 type:complete len:524 (+) Transcript_14125:101-1672(+)
MMRVVVLLLGLFLVGLAGAQQVTPGNDDLGCSYDIAWYADPNGVERNLCSVFNPPNTSGTCNGMALSSDITCGSGGTDEGASQKIENSNQQTQDRSSSMGFGISLGFSASVSREHSENYYQSVSYALSTQYRKYKYYSLTLDYKARGLTAQFEKDAVSMTDCKLPEHYGYYFLVAGEYGGTYTFSQSSTYSHYTSAEAASTAIEGGYSNATASGGNSNNRTGANEKSESESVFYAKGGNMDCLSATSSCDWVTSCRDTPALMDFSSTSGAQVPILSLDQILQAFNYDSEIVTRVKGCVDAYRTQYEADAFVALKHGSVLPPISTGIVGSCAEYTNEFQCTTDDPENNYLTSMAVHYNVQDSNDPNDGITVTGLDCYFSKYTLDDPANDAWEEIKSVGGGGTAALSPLVVDAKPGYAITRVRQLVDSNEDCFKAAALGLSVTYAEVSPLGPAGNYIANSAPIEDFFYYTNTISSTVCGAAGVNNAGITKASFVNLHDGTSRSCQSISLDVRDVTCYKIGTDTPC